MNRIIRFRLWDKKHESFVNEPFYAISLLGTLQVNGHSTVEPSRYVIQQFTGLQDCKGKDIYEGDIIRAETYKDHKNKQRIDILLVEYVNSILMPFHDIIVDNDYWCEGFSGKYEVIGNIYEHPNLLQKEQQ